MADERSDIQFSCLPFDAAAPLILEINGIEVDPAMDTRLSVVDFNGDNRTYTYSSVLLSENNSTIQCFSSDRSQFSDVTTLFVLGEDMYNLSIQA